MSKVNRSFAVIAKAAAKKFIEGTPYKSPVAVVESGLKTLGDWSDCLRAEHDNSGQPEWMDSAIGVLQHSGAITVKDFASLMFIDQANASYRLNYMLNKNLVTREAKDPVKKYRSAIYLYTLVQ